MPCNWEEEEAFILKACKNDGYLGTPLRGDESGKKLSSLTPSCQIMQLVRFSPARLYTFFFKGEN